MKRGSAVHCAIYTRVSSDQGLEQDFNSLDAQYDASQAYIRSQAHAGWTLLRAKYDDGGFSGGKTDRPALQRLLDDVRAGKVDVIVVYKVDRLTRSLADFAKLVELFDQLGKVCQGPGQAVDLVDDDHVDLAGPNASKHILQGRTVERGARERPVIVEAGISRHPSWA